MAAPLEYDFRVIGRAVVEREIAALEKRFISSAAKLNREFAKLGGTTGAGNRTGSSRSVNASSFRFQDAHVLARQREQLRQTKVNERAAVKAVREERRQVENLNRSRQSLHNQRIREEKQVGVESAKTNAQKQRDIDRQSRSQQSLARQRSREEAKARESTKARVDFFKSTVGGGIGRVASVLSSVGKAGLAVAGISAAGIAASSISQAVTLDEGSRRLSIAGRNPGSQGADPASLSKSFTQTGIATGIAPEAVMSGVRAYVAKTGDLSTAMANSRTYATVAQGGDANVEDIFNMAATMKDALKLSNPNDMKEAFAVFSQQGKKGRFELKDFASEGPEILTAAATAGVHGVGGVRDIGALAQIGMLANNSKSENATSIRSIFMDAYAHAGKIESGAAFGGHKVQLYEGGDHTKGMRNMQDWLIESISATHGDMSQLGDAYNRRAIKTIMPLRNAYSEAYNASTGTVKEKDAAGVEAARALFSKFRDLPADFGSVEQDAADAMKSFSVQMEIINTKLKDAIASQLFPVIVSMIPEFEKLIPVVADILRSMLRLISFLDHNPFLGLGLAVSASIVGEIAKAGISSAITAGLTALLGGGATAATTAATAAGALGATAAGAEGTAALGAGGFLAGGALATGAAVTAAVGATVLAGYEGYQFGKENGGFGSAVSNFWGAGDGKGWGFDAIDDEANQKARTEAGVSAYGAREGGDMSHGGNSSAVEAIWAAKAASDKEAAAATLRAAEALEKAATSVSGITPNRSDKPSGIKP